MIGLRSDKKKERTVWKLLAKVTCQKCPAILFQLVEEANKTFLSKKAQQTIEYKIKAV